MDFEDTAGIVYLCDPGQVLRFKVRSEWSHRKSSPGCELFLWENGSLDLTDESPAVFIDAGPSERRGRWQSLHRCRAVCV